ncbi:MAG: hypothetical protein AAB447_03880 [Patescibacteria group bacterium]
MEQIINFFNHPFFIVVGGLTVCLAVLGIIYRIVCWFLGVTPILFRLGRALWGRKVAVFASADAYKSIEATLTDTGIFRQKNVTHIPLDNVDKAKDETVFLVHWETFSEQIERVFAARGNHQTPIIIFAKPAIIPKETMEDIANRANTVVVNFRGRLLNDILTSLMTTSYEKK